MTNDRESDSEAPRIRTDVQNEPVNVDADGLPQARDPQAGMVIDDDSHEPEVARELHPRVGDEIGL